MAPETLGFRRRCSHISCRYSCLHFLFRTLQHGSRRAFGADRIVLDLQRLRMDFPLPCPGGEGVYLTGEQLAQRQRGRAVFYSRTLGARYFTYRSGSGTRFVLFDDGDTLRRKIALGRQLGITRGLLTLPECGDILDEVI